MADTQRRAAPRESAAFVALKKAGREALRLEAHLTLDSQWLAEIGVTDRAIPFEFPLRTVYRPIKIQRSEDGRSLLLDHGMALIVNDSEEDDDFFFEAPDSQVEGTELGSVTYAQRWSAKRGKVVADDTQILLFALTVGRRHATERARDLILMLSSHLGRPPLATTAPPSPDVALDDLLDGLRLLI